MTRVLIFLLLILFSGMQLFAQISVQKLVCENQVNPIGLQVKEPQLSWQLVSGDKDVLQSAYEIEVRWEEKPIWKTGKVFSSQSIHVPYDGPKLMAGQRYHWQVRVYDNKGRRSAWSKAAFWQMGLLDTSAWKAKWIETVSEEDTITRPAQLFRKSFRTGKPIKNAVLYITSHGLYRAFINGKPAGDALFTPGYTSYHNRLQYQTYVVTEKLQQGENAIGVILADGWYRGDLGWHRHKNVYGHTLGLLCQLEITYTDGSKQWILSDESWKSSTGVIRSSSIYDGEVWDARKEQHGWDTPEFNASAWNPVKIVAYAKSNLTTTIAEPVREQERLFPKSITQLSTGRWLLDFGQNLSGYVVCKLKGKKGDTITVKHAEVLDKQSQPYFDNLRTARQTNKYELNGDSAETFQPMFSFQGFRYALVENYTGPVNQQDFQAVALYSDMPAAGSFSCSDSLINQLQQNIQWGQKGNFLDIPTDCPQRDERLGWTGDAQVFFRTAAFNRHVSNFFGKWLKDLTAEQKPDGNVPFYVPRLLTPTEYGAAGWADAATIIPWQLYQVYGNKRILEEQYNSMKAWVDYVTSRSVNHLWNTNWHYGDWLFYRPVDDLFGEAAITDKHFIAQCFWAHSTQLVIHAAKVLNNVGDVERYEALLHRIKAAFIKEYISPNGRLMSNTQTAYVLALHFDMAPDSLQQVFVKRLVENIQLYNYHLTTGFLGTPYLCHVLTRFGLTDVAYRIFLQKDFPSWLYPVTNGATTIWERWDGIKPDGSFQDVGMNSFNHYAYGAIGDWMYQVVAGIRQDELHPGYKHFIIQPEPGGTLTEAKASYQSGYGTISVQWVKKDGAFQLWAEVPPNTTATVKVPYECKKAVFLGADGKEQDVNFSADAKGQARITIGSGKYLFVSGVKGKSSEKD
jgi:alpha-L-rhamnosidase